MITISHPAGLLLGILVGGVLGLLGGGGSILALPIFLYVFGVETNSAVAMSLAVVGTSAFIGFLGHWRQGTVSMSIGLPYGICAMIGGFVAARLAHLVPPTIKLSLFVVFAAAASVMMLRDSLRTSRASGATAESVRAPRFTSLVALQALLVGMLTAIIGAGGGFVIVPALVLLAGLDVRLAVGSSLLVIAMNSASAFSGYVGHVAIDWPLVTAFTALAAVGVVVGTRFVRFVPQARLKQGFAVMILVLGSYLVAREVHKALITAPSETHSSAPPQLAPLLRPSS